MPAPPKASGMYDCTPTFKLKYRVAYIGVAWLITSLVLVKYSTLLTGFIPETNFTREFLMCGGQVVFQLLAVGFFAKGKIMDYLGNMMTVSLIGALLLLPALMAGSIFPDLPAEIFIAYFMGVVGFMLYEHARRMKILELGWWPSASWVLYRCLVLGVLIWPQITLIAQI
jgi:hypothetical protein